jgi:hypothetical protein
MAKLPSAATRSAPVPSNRARLALQALTAHDPDAPTYSGVISRCSVNLIIRRLIPASTTRSASDDGSSFHITRPADGV